MVQYSMAYYTQLVSTDIHQIAQRYNLTVKKFAPLEGGAANSSYLIDTGKGQHILTIVEEKPFPEVIKTALLLDHLAQHQYSTSRLVKANNGKKVTRFQDKGVLIKKYITGRPVRQISKKGLRALGRALAKLHLIPAPDYLPHQLPYGQNVFANAYGLGFDSAYEEWLACQQANFLAQCPDGLPHSLIHGDVFWDNIIYLDDEFQALIDFDDACFYFSIYDIGNAISGACVETDGTLNLEKAAQIVAGYQKIRPLTPKEKRALHLFTLYSVVAISHWRYMKYNVHNPIKKKKTLHREKLALAEHIQSIPPKKFKEILE